MPTGEIIRLETLSACFYFCEQELNCLFAEYWIFFLGSASMWLSLSEVLRRHRAGGSRQEVWF